MIYYSIRGNDDLKRFEFQSTHPNLISYTIAYHEADNITDAKIAVYKALKKEADRVSKSLSDFFDQLAATGIC